MTLKFKIDNNTRISVENIRPYFGLDELDNFDVLSPKLEMEWGIELEAEKWGLSGIIPQPPKMGKLIFTLDIWDKQRFKVDIDCSHFDYKYDLKFIGFDFYIQDVEVDLTNKTITLSNR